MSYPKLYYILGSPPVSAVLMAAQALGVELEKHTVDVAGKETHEKWFKKMNPTHTVPLLEDDGFHVWDSHAIMIYLVEKYGVDSLLYSNDVTKKARINQLLFFECGTLFRRFSDCVKPLFYENQNFVEEKYINNLIESYSVLEEILSSSTFLVGDELTIADISMFATLLPSNVVTPISESAYPKLYSYLEYIKALPFANPVNSSVETFKAAYDQKVKN